MQNLFPVFDCKGIFYARKREIAEKQRKQGIARNSVHRKVPFQSRTKRPNSTPRFVSFDTWLGDPALVLVSVFEPEPLLTVFRTCSIISVFLESGLIGRGFWPDWCQVWSIMARRVSILANQ